MDQDECVVARPDEKDSAQVASELDGTAEVNVQPAPLQKGGSSDAALVSVPVSTVAPPDAALVSVPVSTVAPPDAALVSVPVSTVTPPDVAALVAPIATALADAVVNAAASAASVASTVASGTPAATSATIASVVPVASVAPGAPGASVVPVAPVAPAAPGTHIAPGVPVASGVSSASGASVASVIPVSTGVAQSREIVSGSAERRGEVEKPVIESGGPAVKVAGKPPGSALENRATAADSGSAEVSAAAARQNAVERGPKGSSKSWQSVHSWKLPVACACILLGIMVGLQYRAQASKGSLQIDDRRQLTELVRTMESERNKMSKELKETRAQMVDMEEAAGKRELVSKQLQDQLVRSRIEAGLTGMKGPGVVISMSDSPRTAPATEDNYFYIVHDVDLTALVNELWAAGAEAVCVNDQRIVTRSSIRCVGPAVLVNGVRLTAPYIIKAIGSKDLETALRMPGGFLNSMAPLISKGGEVKMNSMDEVVIPPYEGSSSYRFGQSFEKTADTAAAENEKDDDEGSKGLW